MGGRKNPVKCSWSWLLIPLSLNFITFTAVSDNKIGGSCTTTTAVTKGSCEDPNALCSATTDGKCGCKAGYTGTDGAGCSECLITAFVCMSEYILM